MRTDAAACCRCVVVVLLCVCGHSRSVSVHPDGVDAALGEAAALQEGAVVADVHALPGVVAALEQLDAVVLAVLTGRKLELALLA